MSNQYIKFDKIHYYPTSQQSDEFTLANDLIKATTIRGTIPNKYMFWSKLNGQVATVVPTPPATPIQYVRYDAQQKEYTKPYYSFYADPLVESGATIMTIHQDCTLQFELSMAIQIPDEGLEKYAAVQIQIHKPDGKIEKPFYVENIPNGVVLGVNMIGCSTFGVQQGDKVLLALIAQGQLQPTVTVAISSIIDGRFPQDCFIGPTKMRINIL
jgi:hypothetical protein